MLNPTQNKKITSSSFNNQDLGETMSKYSFKATAVASAVTGALMATSAVATELNTVLVTSVSSNGSANNLL